MNYFLWPWGSCCIKLVTYLDKNPNLAKLYLQYKKKLVKQIIRKPYFIIKNLICHFFLCCCPSLLPICRQHHSSAQNFFKIARSITRLLEPLEHYKWLLLRLSCLSTYLNAWALHPFPTHLRLLQLYCLVIFSTKNLPWLD